MFRNYLAAALRNLARNKLHAGINLFGLTVGLATALLIALFVRDELSYDAFVREPSQVFRLDATVAQPGQAPRKIDLTFASAAAALKLDYPEIQAVARISSSHSGLRRGEFEALDRVIWADPTFFEALPLAVIAGDARTALEQPDSVVMTRSMARKYFGEDTPVGKVIDVNPALDSLPNLKPAEAQTLGSYHPMRVTAILEDLPSNTHLNGQIFAAAQAPFSPMWHWEALPGSAEVFTYLRLKPGATADAIRRDLPRFGERHYPDSKSNTAPLSFQLTALTDIHLTPAGAGAMKPSGDPLVIAGIAAIGLLIAIIAGINFVALTTARSAQRAREVGVRKAAGATRTDLVVQFMGEALIHVTLAMLLAVAVAEFVLPRVNAMLGRSLQLDYLHNPALVGWLVAATLTVGLLTGLYPALHLSGLAPAATLRQSSTRVFGPARVRQLLVGLQFAILIGLLIATATIYRQTMFALHNNLQVNTRNVLSVFTYCDAALKRELQALPGIAATACTSSPAIGRRQFPTPVQSTDGSALTLQGAPVDIGFFELHGLTPIAGRFFTDSRQTDAVLQSASDIEAQPPVVLNESAVRQLGFDSPRAAIGASIAWARRNSGSVSNQGAPLRSSQIIGVVPDFSFSSVRTRVDGSLYYVDPRFLLWLTIRLNDRDVAQTLSDVDRVWKKTGHLMPMQRTFEDESMRALYEDVITQGFVVGGSACLALLIACLGLFALSAFATERRRKEIGVRKAMGAGTSDIVQLLAWQFARPAVWANLVAWPVAGFAMHRWLGGFAYHVNLQPWVFAAAAVTALIIALLTVSLHSFLAARSKPAAALRWE
jgi:putative ABC transport system permease protein